MEHLIPITRNKIKAVEPCIPKYYNHEIKGSCIGYGFSAQPNSVLPAINKLIENTITVDEANIVLDYSIRQNHKILTENIGQFYDYLSDNRKSAFINLSDLLTFDLIMVRFKTSLNYIAENDFKGAVDLMMKNYLVQQFYTKNKRLRACLNDLLTG